MWSLLQSPLIVGTDVRNMTPIMNKILNNNVLLDMHQDTSVQPGEFIGFSDACPGVCSVWTRPFNATTVFVVVLNTDGVAFDASVSAEQIGWSPTQPFDVLDVWSGARTRGHVGTYSSTVQSHGVLALILTQ
jgi:alpha-galactosidase